MAKKIDLTTVKGYSDTLTAEEKLALLDSIELPDPPDFTGYIEKSKFDKTASELAEAKRQLKAKMTEDEQKAQEEAAARAQIQSELEQLRKEKTISESKSRFLGLGYDESLATDAAAALAEGNMDKVFEAQRKYIDAIKKASTASSMASNPKPPAGQGTPPDAKTALKEQYEKYTQAGNFVAAFDVMEKIKQIDAKT